MVFPFLTTVFAGAESCSGCRRWSGAGLRSPLHFSCRGGGAGAGDCAVASAGAGDRGGAQ